MDKEQDWAMWDLPHTSPGSCSLHNPPTSPIANLDNKMGKFKDEDNIHSTTSTPMDTTNKRLGDVGLTTHIPGSCSFHPSRYQTRHTRLGHLDKMTGNFKDKKTTTTSSHHIHPHHTNLQRNRWTTLNADITTHTTTGQITSLSTMYTTPPLRSKHHHTSLTHSQTHHDDTCQHTYRDQWPPFTYVIT